MGHNKMPSEEIPGTIAENEDDNFMIEVSNSVSQPISTNHYIVLTDEQYEADLKEAYFNGWDDRNDCELLWIFHRRKATKEDYFKWYMDTKLNKQSKVKQENTL